MRRAGKRTCSPFGLQGGVLVFGRYEEAVYIADYWTDVGGVEALELETGGKNARGLSRFLKSCSPVTSTAAYHHFTIKV
jgi:hypothetical protein